MKVVSPQRMYAYDHTTIENFGSSSRLLMEIAGKGCADWICERYPTTQYRNVLVLCGHGNNGGDGFVIARWLRQYGYSPEIAFYGSFDKMSPETMANWEATQKLSILQHAINDIDLSNVERELKQVSLVVDAFYGIGFKGELPDPIQVICAELAQTNIPVIAVDIPSGLDASTGLANSAIKATATLSMSYTKFGHLLNQGRLFSGEIVPIDIGIQGSFLAAPDKATSSVWEEGTWVDAKNVKLPTRLPNNHKGNYGRVAIIAGSPGYSGAAVMAAEAALHSGAGLVTLYTHPDNLNRIRISPEIMCHGLPILTPGRYDSQALLQSLSSQDCLLVGPGIGKSDSIRDLLAAVLPNWHKPTLLDADALNLLSENPTWWFYLDNSPILLTPHPIEFSRLIEREISDWAKDPLSALHRFVKEHNMTVLLKGYTSLAASPDNLNFITTGNDGLATGGSGDVLSGIIASFIGQGLSMMEAASAGAWVLGSTAEKLADTYQTPGITPSSIIKHLFMK